MAKNEPLYSSKSPHTNTKLVSLNEFKCNNPSIMINAPKNILTINNNPSVKPLFQHVIPSATSRHNAASTGNRLPIARGFTQKELNPSTNVLRNSFKTKSSESNAKNRSKIITKSNLIPSQTLSQRTQAVNTTTTYRANENFEGIRSAGLVADALQQQRNSQNECASLNSNFSSFPSSNTCSISKNATKWRPPKRTAEEIVLDKLEVNWSVPHIRSVFQQHKDVKPTSIDTVYARVS